MESNKLSQMNFNKYNIDAEVYNSDETKRGDYWKLTYADDNEIDRLFMCSNIAYVLPNIQNNELKNRIKDRLLQYIYNTNTISYAAMHIYKSDLLNTTEISDILKSDKFKSDIVEKINNSKYFDKQDIKNIVETQFYFENIADRISGISDIIELIKLRDNYNENLVCTLEEVKHSKDIELYSYLSSKYYNELPEYYQNYLRIKDNSNYLYDKSSKYASQGVEVGIDPNINIGVEIEANGHLPYIFSDFLYAQNDFYKYFKTDIDVTVPNGIEIVSKPFNDKIEDISTFCAVCETMKELGYYYDENTANASFQINLGLDYLDTAKSILTFYELFGNCEELLYYISNEEDQIIRNPIMTSRFSPISKNIGTRVIDEEISRDSVIEMFNVDLLSMDNEMNLQYKRGSVCLRGTSDDDYRLEIRIPNSTVNYKACLDNIRLYGKMMELSKKIADVLRKDSITKDEEELLNKYVNLQDKSLGLADKLVLLMDFLFDDNNIKNVYYGRYVSTLKKIKETQTRKYDIDVDNVEFQNLYESKLEQNGNISYDPKTGTYIEDGVISYMDLQPKKR